MGVGRRPGSRAPRSRSARGRAAGGGGRGGRGGGGRGPRRRLPVGAVARECAVLVSHQTSAISTAVIWNTFATLLTHSGQPPFRNARCGARHTPSPRRRSSGGGAEGP